MLVINDEIMKLLALLREVFPRKTSTDWVLFLSVILVVSFGLVTMSTFVGENFLFEKDRIL